jgi:hypothetical protein
MKILSAVLILFVLSSCIKYEEGPSFSFLTKEKRLSRSWKMEKIEYYNGMDSTYTEGTLYSFSLDFRKDKTLVYAKESNGTLVEINSTWDWHLGTWGLTLDLTENIPVNNGLRNYQILRLSKKELWIYDRATGHKYYFISE